METVTDFIFLDSKFTADGDCNHGIRTNKQKQTNKKKLASWKKSYDKLRQLFKKQRHHFADKGLYSQIPGFSSSHVWMRQLNYKES